MRYVEHRAHYVCSWSAARSRAPRVRFVCVSRCVRPRSRSLRYCVIARHARSFAALFWCLVAVLAVPCGFGRVGDCSRAGAFHVCAVFVYVALFIRSFALFFRCVALRVVRCLDVAGCLIAFYVLACATVCSRCLLFVPALVPAIPDTRVTALFDIHLFTLPVRALFALLPCGYGDTVVYSADCCLLVLVDFRFRFA